MTCHTPTEIFWSYFNDVSLNRKHITCLLTTLLSANSENMTNVRKKHQPAGVHLIQLQALI